MYVRYCVYCTPTRSEQHSSCPTSSIKRGPLGKMDKAKTDNTMYSLFSFETFIFNVTPTIIHNHFLFFVTNSHSLRNVIQPSLEKYHPKGLFQRLCVVQLETRLNTSQFLRSSNIYSKIEATAITAIAGTC